DSSSAPEVQRHCFTNQALQSLFVDRVVLLDVDRAPHLSLEAGVEETRRIVQRGALEERQLDDALVGLTCADAAVVGPDRCSRARGLRPLPLLDDIGVRVLDHPAHTAQRLAAPVAELLDALVDLLRSVHAAI